MNKLLLVALVATIACRGSGAPHDKKTTGSGSQGSGSAVAADPWQAKDAGPVVPETPEMRKQRAEAALARVEAIQPKLAKLRGLPFDHPVPTAYQTTDDFKAFLHREIAKDLPPDKSKRLSTAYLHIGLLQKPIDLATAYEQTMATQAAAYYDPAAKKFFMVMVPDNDMLLDTMSAHELTHGLQDQRFDLTKFMAAKPPLDDDAQVAHQFIVEGDATFAMFLYMAAEASKSDAVQAMMIKVLRGQIEQFAQMDLAAYGEMMKQQAAAFKDMDSDLKKSMEAMGELPPMVVGPLLDSYMKGALVVLTAYDKGGWPMVDALYKDPPESSEQVLHPATKLIPKREHPKKVTLPKLDGEVVNSNVLGELLWNIYFSLWVPDQKVQASEGWGGDRYTVVKRADGSLLAYHATIWDTVEDAKQFATAYEASFAKRFPGNDRKHAIKTDGAKVFILDGSDDAKLLAQLIKGTKFS
ncbi:MAG TPA: hypothetical protein VIV40_09735 [Kofleriaceae bacterium]